MKMKTRRRRKKARTIRSLLVQFFEERGESQSTIDQMILSMAMNHPGELDEIVPQCRLEEFSRCLWTACGEAVSMSPEQLAREVKKRLNSCPTRN